MLISLVLLIGGWSFASATFFFIVPEVAITLIAVRQSWEAAFAAAGIAIAGTLAGGALMFAWAGTAPDSAIAFISSLPDVSAQNILDVRFGLIGDWPSTVTTSLLSLTPFKIVAVEAGKAVLPVFSFFIVTGAVLTVRFLACALIAGLAGRLLSGWITANLATVVLLTGWTVVYVVMLGLVTPGA